MYPTRKNYQLLSLFSGAGGLDLGFNCAGFETVLALDHCPDAVKTFNHNFKSSVARRANLARLTEDHFLDMVPSDSQPFGLIGGPPCQGFSRGNVYSKSSDPRNRLPYRFAKLLKVANLKYNLHFFVFENVVGLVRKKHAQRFKRILTKLRNAGFNVFYSELNAGEFGVPQRRHRLFIVGLNSALYPNLEFKFPSKLADRKYVEDVLSDLPTPTFFQKGLQPEKFPHHPNHWTMMPKSSKFTSIQVSKGRSFRRLEWDKVSPTVAYGNREIHVHPDGHRRLSIYEAMLLQGFPDSYRLIGSLSSQVRQVSNAVPPPVAHAIATAIKLVVDYREHGSASHQLRAVATIP
jgi:DNA (cytosine-5)-methyltransferase 1